MINLFFFVFLLVKTTRNGTLIIILFINCRLIPGTLIALTMSYSSVAAKSLAIDKFMADTVTDLGTLESRPKDMKTIMELMIMEIQVNCKTKNFIILMTNLDYFLGGILSST